MASEATAIGDRRFNPIEFDRLLPATLATAAVDRFMHRAHLVVAEGDSYRFAQACDGKGVTPLT